MVLKRLLSYYEDINYYSEYSQYGHEQFIKINLKNFKKVVDTGYELAYNNEAVAKAAAEP